MITTIVSTTATPSADRASSRRHLRRMAGALAVAALASPLLLAGTASASPLSGSIGTAPVRHNSSSGLTPVSTPVGVNFHGLWTSYTDAQRATVLDRLAAAGVDSVRLDVSWIMLQPNNSASYDAWGVAFVDRVIAMANQRGIKPLVMLWLTPGWANGNAGQRALPTNPADYARVANYAAKRWSGKVVGWEVWNEPNDTAFMTGADPVAYTRLLKAAYPAFKAADPTTPVVTGGVQYNDDTWIRRMYDGGAKGYFDAIGSHPYQGIANAAPSLANDGTRYTLTHAVAIHDLMVARGDGAKKIWFTELGWSTHANTAGTANWNLGVTETVQSDYLVQAADLVQTTMPWVQRMYWYDDRDTTTGNVQYDSYGLLHANLTPKLAMNGLAKANS
jgi:polysaccharide biosynthesis protein PslG